MLGYLDRFLFPLGDVPSSATALPGLYDPALVIASVLIAIFAAYAALDVAGRVAAASTPMMRMSWLGAGAASLGLGIWAMHFIGMLAFSLPCGISYDPWITILSIVPGMLASGVALHLISREGDVSWLTLTVGAVLMGAGIGAMHYSGMDAIRLPALLSYDAVMVGVSVLVAVALAFLALSLRCIHALRDLFGRYSTVVSAVIMGTAIAGMHYTAMDAAIFFPFSDTSDSPSAINPTILAILIILLAVFVIAMALAAGFAGRQFETALRLKDESESRRLAEQEALRGRVLQAVLDSVADAIVTAGTDGLVRHWSRAAERIFGYDAVEARALGLLSLMPESELTRSMLDHGGSESEAVSSETIGFRRDGTSFPLEISLCKVSAGDEVLITGVLRDITERRAVEEKMHRLAHHDALTGLPNRLSLLGRLEQVLSSARRSGEPFAVLFLDLDRFKIINDTLGHHIGDKLLQEVAGRVSSCVRASDIVARLGGDEFVVVLTAIKTTEIAARQAAKILKQVGNPYIIDGHELNTTPSIGIALYPNDGDTIDGLMKNADAAMYSAKAGGRNNCQFFTAAMNQAANERLMLEHSMRQGLTRGEFVVHYQPQISVEHDRVVGFEALVRWHHPTEGMISPARFIPVAEDTGLIKPLGEHVLREALRELKGWQKSFGSDFRVAVNLSAAQLRDQELPTMVAQALADAGIEPGNLELEITESVAMAKPEETIKILERLRDMGVELAVDDFGTGYSSLAYLKHLPIQRLKIDQSFVRDIETDSNDAAICTATIALAHSMKLEVIAEGVETEAQLAYLTRLGTDVVQGYLLSKPLPPAQLREFLSARKIPELVAG